MAAWRRVSTNFRGLLSHLGLTELAAEVSTVVDGDAPEPDEEATALLRDAVPLLREDLARNDPVTETALEVGWDRLAALEVRVAIDLRVSIAHLTVEWSPVVAVAAKADPDAGVLYLKNSRLLDRVNGGGQAIAGLFAADRRRVAQAWLAACEDARAGREAQRLQFAAERAADQEARNATDIAVRLAEFRQQTGRAHERGRETRSRGAAQSSSPAGQTPPVVETRTSVAASRVLVDPTRLRVADARGRLVGPAPIRDDDKRSASGARSGGAEKPSDLPVPKPGGAAPHHVAAPPRHTAGSKETVGLDLVRMVLGCDADKVSDLRAQHGVGADAVDALERFFELKVYAGAEPDRITLENAQIRRAMSTPHFFLVIVSGVEGRNANPKVRVIVDPLSQLEMTETSSVAFTGVRNTDGVVFDLVPDESSAHES